MSDSKSARHGNTIKSSDEMKQTLSIVFCAMHAGSVSVMIQSFAKELFSVSNNFKYHQKVTIT